MLGEGSDAPGNPRTWNHKEHKDHEAWNTQKSKRVASLSNGKVPGHPKTWNHKGHRDHEELTRRNQTEPRSHRGSEWTTVPALNGIPFVSFVPFVVHRL